MSETAAALGLTSAQVLSFPTQPVASTDSAALPPNHAEQARLELDRLKNDESWVKRHLAGDHSTKADVERLTQAMHSQPGAVITGLPSIEQQRGETADYLAEFGPGLSPGVIEQIRKGIPEAASSYREAMSLKKSLLADPDFRQKYLDGNSDARRRMALINVIEAGPINLGK